MTQRTIRWIACDFPGCVRRFDTEHQRAAQQASNRPLRSIRDAAVTMGWERTEEGDDLCKWHADMHRGRPPQPSLFPVPGDDHPV